MEEFKKYNFNGLNINSKGEYIMLTPEILGRPLREKEYEYNMLFAANSNVNSDVRINKNYQSLMATEQNTSNSTTTSCANKQRLGTVPQPNVNVNVNVNFTENVTKQEAPKQDVNIEKVKYDKSSNKLSILETDGEEHTIDVGVIQDNIQEKLDKEYQVGCW